MGEVYRCDDLKLGLAVALKFLPTGFERDSARLARLTDEVRTARQVTHPNVCRIHDLNEVDGHHFISMEYVDGEDLASLLRRIGRLSGEKALEIARQLCSGVAAAHERGIMHRDIKPENVMIDGRGQVRITDFGLAASEDSIASTHVREGTPRYMAPEQLSGREVTTRSDVYSLGIVLCELFTGCRPSSATAEAAGQDEGQTLELPFADIELDPGVEELIRACLSPDPEQRPASARAVAAALPGGDGLAAAVAAGETPSPRMVAEAGDVGTLRTPVAFTCVICVLAGIAALFPLYDQRHLIGRVGVPKPPEVLAAEARDLLAAVGYDDVPADRAAGFDYDQARLEALRQQADVPDRWARLDELPPSAIRFWYRESPEHLLPRNFRGVSVTPSDPPLRTPRMALVTLEPSGRLLSMHVVPPARDEEPSSTGEPLWPELFERAGLDLDDFRSARPLRVPSVYADERRAWTGPSGLGRVEVRVEAAAFAGRPVAWEVIFPWSQESPSVGSESLTSVQIFLLLLLFTLLGGALLLARRNLRAGRGDPAGATRLATAWFLITLVSWLFGASHVPGFGEAGLFLRGASWGLLTGVMAWLIYIALEPEVRRRWPTGLISWSRLLEGRWRDAMIGRDILIGGAAGIAVAVIESLAYALPQWLGMAASEPLAGNVGGFPEGALRALAGVPQALNFYIFMPQVALSSAIATLFVLVLLQVLLRWRWAAIAGTAALLTSNTLLNTGDLGVDIVVALPSAAILLWVLLRYGLLALALAILYSNLDQVTPLPMDPGSWYLGRSLLLVSMLIALLLVGFRLARGSSPTRQHTAPG